MYRCILLRTLLLIFCFWSASSFGRIDSSTNETSVEDNGSYYNVSIAAPNSSGISFNYFSHFDSAGKEINLVNVPSYVTQGNSDRAQNAANLIVIVANNIRLNSTVRVVGPATDVVFLARGNSSALRCENCVLENLLRVSLLATENKTFSSAASSLGDFTSGDNNDLYLNNVYAPGVIALDLMGYEADIRGVIDTNVRASIRNGDYVKSENGNKKIGAATTSFILGHMTWDYDSNKLKKAELPSPFYNHTIEADIYSVGVKILSSSGIGITGNISTKVDVISAVAYKNGTHLSEEAIGIYVYTEWQGPGITLSGRVSSDGVLDIGSIGNVHIDDEAELEVGTLNVVAKANAAFEGLVYADKVKIGAGLIRNEGEIFSEGLLELYADLHVLNQYGGILSGEDVIMKTDGTYGIVRNGSRVPYATYHNYYSGEAILEKPLALIDQIYLIQDNKENATQIGTFYSLPSVTQSALRNNPYESVREPKNSATIIAKNLEVEAKAFENINPYYVTILNFEELEMRAEYVDQVQLSVENNIKIKAEQYVLNSSAKWVQHGSHGTVSIETDIFSNERFRVEHELFYTPSAGTIGHNESIIGTRTVGYSPPGHISVMGNMEVKAESGVFNNTAYIEIFGSSAEFETPLLTSMGQEHQAAINSSTISVIDVDLRHGGGSDVIQTRPELIVVDPNVLDSLFYVVGNFVSTAFSGAEDSDTTGLTYFANYSPFDFYIDQMINATDYYEYDVGDTRTESRRLNVQCDFNDVGPGGHDGGPCYELRNVTITVDSEENTYDIDQIKATGNVTVETTVVENISPALRNNDPSDEFTITTTAGRLFDKLRNFYNSIANTLGEIFDEYKWW